jgi:MFS transporter, PAT family, beta-lactamase induction signal transducer AmpG
VENLPSWLRVFLTRKMLAILVFGFVSGLPFALVDDAFRAWMTKANLDLSTIGWFGLVSIPYSFKFLWSPFIDRYIPPFLGRRRGWIVVSEIGLFLAILGISAQMAYISNLTGERPAFALQLVAFFALIIAFLSATQDIAIDAYRTDILTKIEVGTGAALAILGYRIALLTTGWLAFVLADQITWAGVYSVMAFLLIFGVVAAIFAPEPVTSNQAPETLEEAVVQPFLDFFHRLGKKAIFALLFIILYKLGDAIIAKMAVPFLGGKGIGFSDTDIGNIRQGLGLFATIVGTLTGGAILSKIGINKSLWVFGILQALSNFGYFFLALIGKNYLALILAINVENFTAGLGTAGFLGFLMSLCNPSFSATQFALLSSLMAVGRDLIAAPVSGEMAQRILQYMQANPDMGKILLLGGVDGKGWALFFLISTFLAVPGLLLLPIFAPWNQDNNGQSSSEI